MTMLLCWQELPLNRIIRMRSGDFISNDDIELEGAYPVYGGNGFRGFTDRFNAVGPIVLVGRQGAHCGNVHVADEQIWVSEHALRCLPEKKLDAKWLAYTLRDMNLNQYSVSAAQPGLSVDNLKHLRTAVPPLDTQKRIARFLDEKTARVDGLIEKKRVLLDRLVEKRQTLITCAVTNGLNPDAPLKPSGIDLIGDIPAYSQATTSDQPDQGGHHRTRGGHRRAAEWARGMTELTLPPGCSLKRLKYLATYNDEVLAESTDEEKEIDYVEISGVSLSHGIEEIERVTFGQAPSRARRKVRSSDILISTVRTYLRAIATVDEASPDLIASTGFCVVRPNDDVDSGFLGWAVKSEPFVSEVVARSVGVSYPAINASELVTIDVPLPPLETQRRIARYLDEKTVRVDAIAKQVFCSIESLSEYRSALITAAVTGQLSELP